ncbi:class I SAM-dependent methyltransferase [Ancylobacter pratisalsi]|uniref:Class I SAM-dependent methyltransferase n=1 Tax=Ancylobacter pratisalsi TaxID=1745854 RepID=A0A6P1YMX0_9HYPH|nr:class I SAM-dependent methyltransferase [Ancylobacter pratisalsi]QIB34485.1 class I SAM-dependent methyltransferase [Ancylobacter pratisalsi]
MDSTGEGTNSADVRQTVLERLHLYALAREFCRGYDVLDVDCGEGDGSALLAQVARSVVGVDPSPEAIAKARVRASGSGLRFEAGDALQMDLPAGSFDRVVCLSAPSGREALGPLIAMAAKRLRPGGQLILSVPERGSASGDAAADLDDLLKTEFAHRHVMSPRAIHGSILVPDGGSLPSGVVRFLTRDGLPDADVPRAAASILVASSVPITTTPGVLFFESDGSDDTPASPGERLQAALDTVDRLRAGVERHRREAERERQLADHEARRLEQARDEVARARRDADMLRAVVGQHLIAIGAQAVRAPDGDSQGKTGGLEDWRYLYDLSQERVARLEEELSVARQSLKLLNVAGEGGQGSSEIDTIGVRRLKRQAEEWQERYERLHGRIDSMVRKFTPRIWRKAVRKHLFGPAEEG